MDWGWPRSPGFAQSSCRELHGLGRRQPAHWAWLHVLFASERSVATEAAPSSGQGMPQNKGKDKGSGC